MLNVREALQGLASQIRKVQGEFSAMASKQSLIEKLLVSQRSITAEIDAIPGRRLYYTLTGRIAFDINDDGRRGQPINMLVSQDGAFIQTHYPIAMWLPTAPNNADLFGMWRPVTPWPLPDQASLGAVDLDADLLSISYEIQDSGSQRNFQNEAVPPILSRPDLMVPLPVPTLFAPNSTITFTPTYERILFNSAGVPPTDGQLVVGLPGYRIANL